LLQDYQAKQWLKDYTLAVCKQMLGEARSKFGSIAGPGGAIQMNGAALKSEADKEFEKLDKELMDYTAGGTGYYFVTG
jgi:hypothetical protein